jgi:hypothetical protein
LTSDNQVFDRRRFVRRLVSLAALGAITNLLVGEQTQKASASTAGAVFFDSGSGGQSENSNFVFINSGVPSLCALGVPGTLIIDDTAANGGSIIPGIVFGFGGSGEGITSNRTNSNVTANQYGIDFWTNHEPRMSIANNGFVGINTRLPSAQLDVRAGANTTAITASSSSTNGVVGGVFANTSSPIGIGVWAQDFAMADNFANSGAPLIAELNGGGYIVAKFRNYSLSGERSVVLRLENNVNVSPPQLWHIVLGGVQNGLGLTNGQLYFESPLGVPRVVLTADTGRVGIGAINPEAQLHIGGAATDDIFCGIGPHPAYGGPGPAMNYGYSGSTFGEGSGFFNVRPDASATPPNPSLRFMTVNVQRMIITNTGNVGIGTSNPSSVLHVVGLPVFANNAAATAGGLTAGAFYRTGGDPDVVCVVH